MLKSRPIISVSTHLAEDGLHNIDPGKAGCDLDPESDHACFSFEACFKVESKEDLSLRIKFTIVAEPKKAVSRVWLKLAEVDEVGSSSRSSSVDHMLFIQVKRYLTSANIQTGVSQLFQVQIRETVARQQDDIKC